MTAAFPPDLVLMPISRWPTTLPESSVRAVLDVAATDRVKPHPAVDQPSVSIVIVTCDGLVFSRLCLENLLATASPFDFEVIVVDNGSADGTAEYLGELARLDERVRVVLNQRNAGFAAATNQGVARARGGVIVFLNNDTVPLNGWLRGLHGHLRDDRLGLVGAVTNRAGNEAEIEVGYRTYGELEDFAAGIARAHKGGIVDIRTATMFCAAVRRGVWDEVGPLDEQFEIGLFEDDDFSMRVRRAGFRVVCADDVFVHHFGQASIGRLGATGQYGAVFHANRRRWEAKWGVAWTPYGKRARRGYEVLVEQVRQLVRDTVPDGATVLVISKGDEELLKFDGRHGWHFPQDATGGYAGHHPRDSDDCIAELERLRAKGARFLVIPEPSRWWLQHYKEFARHLEAHYGALGDDQAAAVIVPL